jgi:hypothetical protein
MVLAVQQHAAEPFTEAHWHWTAVLTLQRLATVMFRSLASERVVASLGVTIISFFLVVLQLLAHPYRLKRTNRLQLTAAVCLTLLSTLNLVQSAISSAGLDAEQVSSLVGLGCLDGIMLALLFPPPLLFLHGFLWSCQHGEEEEVVVTNPIAEDLEQERQQRWQLEQQLVAEQHQLEQQLVTEQRQHEQLQQQLEQQRQAEEEEHQAEKQQLEQRLQTEKEGHQAEKQQLEQRHETEKADLLARLELACNKGRRSSS